MPKKIYIRTFGCQMNFLDSELVAGILSGSGYKLVDSPRQADLVLINGCSVREHAEQRVWGQLEMLARLKKNKRLKIGLIGCIAENYKQEIFERFPCLDLVIGPRRIGEIKGLVEKALISGKRMLSCGEEKNLFQDESIARRKNKTCAFVRIMVGCDNFCSYCIVPYVRGRERSRLSGHILAEITKLARNGYQEIILLGQNVNSYGKGLSEGLDFADLLKRVNRVPGIERIGFMTSHPKDISMKLIEAVAGQRKVSKQFHFPVQSGSERILRLMNRGYTSAGYLKLVGKIRQVIPGAGLSTDIMVGFPTETEDDFRMTYDLVKKVKFNNAFIFKYSPRPPAASSRTKDDVSLNEKKERHRVLLSLQQEISRRLKNEKDVNNDCAAILAN